MTLLTIPLLAMSTPEVTVGHVHPAPVVLFVTYGLGLRLLSQIKAEPMWSPVKTHLTQDEQAQATAGKPDRRTTARLWCLFGVSIAVAMT